MTYYFKHPILNLKHKICNNYYMQLQEDYTKTKTNLQFIDDNHTRNYNRIMFTNNRLRFSII